MRKSLVSKMLNPKKPPMEGITGSQMLLDGRKAKITLLGYLQREEIMPACWGRGTISFWLVHFQSNSMQQLCLQEEWADVGSKQMLKSGALSAHRQAIFKLKTQKQTLGSHT
jgi:hypothetical protein